MERKTTLLFLFISLLVPVQTSSCPPNTAERIDKTNKIEAITYLYGEENLTESPAYCIQLFSDKDSYDPGDEVLIVAYISGGGSIEESKILGHIPENVISGKVKLTVFKFATSLKGEWEGWKPVLPPQEFTLSNRFVGDLVKGYFTFQPESPILWSEGEIIDPYTEKSYPPISIAFAISRDTPTGDHKIEFIFKYRSADGKWSIAKETLTIHIRSFVEKYAILLSVVCTAIIGICIAFLSWILSRAR